MRLEISADTLRGDYFTVPRAFESWRRPAHQFDTFQLNLRTHQVR
jgi:hypothetical protein